MTQTLPQTLPQTQIPPLTASQPTVSKADRFWDRIADRYAAKPVSNEAAYLKKLGMTQALMRPDMDVLEIGCGTGSTALAHAPHVRSIISTDLSQRMIEIAEAKAADAGAGNVAFRQAPVEALGLADASFDMVLALNLLHLVRDRDGAICDVYRMLKPGGIFVSSTACIGDGMAFFKLIAPIGRALGLIPHVGIFRETVLRAGLARAGFEIETSWRPRSRDSAFIVARKPA